jgi:large subunit ribosomal protein L25
MSDAFELQAKVRTDLGKGASRRLRRLSNEIPAIIYGGDKDPLSITLSHNEISHAVENETFFSHIITINVDGKVEQVIIKDLQRHPARPFIMHADFQRILADEEITVHVPIHFLNEEKCKGHKAQGGVINKIITDIEVSCLPARLPEFLEVDLLELEIGDSLHISDVKLPAGVTSVDLSHGADGDAVIVTIMAPIVAESDESAEGAAPAEVPVASKGKDKSKED